jgi:hypothetical protein
MFKYEIREFLETWYVLARRVTIVCGKLGNLLGGAYSEIFYVNAGGPRGAGY